MSSDVRDAAIVRHSIDLGRSLGLRVVAEGVESAEDHATLASMGCDHAQGFYYSRPVPAAVFEAWVVEAEGRRTAEARAIAPAAAAG
jgi:EAL domain-containing protein (putative c-di-GMP-specific phosphodiesterase class I)